VAYARSVRISSGATVVQIVWSSRRGSRNIEHLGSTDDEAGLAALKAAVAERLPLAAGQAVLDLGLVERSATEPLPITSSRAGICGMRCAGPTRYSGSIPPPEALRCSGIWCWRGSSTRPARVIRCGCSMRPASRPVVCAAEPLIAGIRQTCLPASTLVRAYSHAKLGPASLVL